MGIKETLHGAITFMAAGIGMLIFGVYEWAMSAGIIGGPGVYGYSTLPGLTVAAFGGGLLALGTYLLCAYLHETEKTKITQ